MTKFIYCELDFLREFVRNIPKPDIFGDDETYLSWKKIYSLLRNNIVIFDKLLSDEEIDELKKKKDTDDSSKALWTIIRDNSEVSNSFRALRENKFEQLTNRQLHSVYLMIINQKKKQEIAQSTGILILGRSEIDKYDSLFANRKISIPANDNTYKDWSELDYPELVRVSNSLIIVDNYILKDTKKFDKNISALLNAVLPYHTYMKYHISLYVKPKGSESDMQLRYDKVHNIIRNIRPELNFTLEVLDSIEKFHDRKLITNNIYIRSGEGFDIFPIKKSTDIDIVFPSMDKSKFTKDEESYNTLIEELRSIDYNNMYGKHRWGEANVCNRLLEIIKSYNHF